MILVLLGVTKALGHFVVGQVFQVKAYFGFHEPHERIHPTNNANKLAEHYINRMALAHGGKLVGKDFFPSFALQIGQISEYPMEEREGIGLIG